MKRRRIGGDAVVLNPSTEDSLRIGIQPGPNGGIAVVLTIDTDNLGSFVIPLSATQIAVLAVVGKRLLALDHNQATQLRSELVREIEEGNQTNG